MYMRPRKLDSVFLTDEELPIAIQQQTDLKIQAVTAPRSPRRAAAGMLLEISPKGLAIAMRSLHS